MTEPPRCAPLTNYTLPTPRSAMDGHRVEVTTAHEHDITIARLDGTVVGVICAGVVATVELGARTRDPNCWQVVRVRSNGSRIHRDAQEGPVIIEPPIARGSSPLEIN